MTEGEWIKLGYEKGIIECETKNTVTFREAYKKWFCMKKRIIKPQSLDRIEVTFNKYYDGKKFFYPIISYHHNIY